MRLLILLLFFIEVPAFAQQGANNLNSLAISQGISSPSQNHPTLFSNGFTFENPVASSYQDGYHLTSALDGAESTSFGLEAGVGDTQYGFAVGAYSNGCDVCDPYVRGTVSAIWGGFGLGFGVQQDLYTMGMLFNPNGLHRVGLVFEFEDPGGIYNYRSALGIGYSYVLPQFTFSLDVSKRDAEDPSVLDQPVLVTPGMAVRVDIFSVSLSYDVFLNDVGNRFSEQLWVGIGMRPYSNLEITFYGEYIDRWTLMGVLYF